LCESLPQQPPEIFLRLCTPYKKVSRMKPPTQIRLIKVPLPAKCVLILCPSCMKIESVEFLDSRISGENYRKSHSRTRLHIYDYYHQRFESPCSLHTSWALKKKEEEEEEEEEKWDPSCLATARRSAANEKPTNISKSNIMGLGQFWANSGGQD
jgi:hypothetical protein